MSHQRKIAVIGLGYVGLPVAIAFAQQGHVIGFDINAQRITELNEYYDCTNEIAADILRQADVHFTTQMEYLNCADFYIITVPTPVNEKKQPDLLPVLKASKTVGNYLKKGDIVVYESTVYPGATEESCIPVLERQSGLQCGKDFSVGYSPERINPGDTKHSFTNVIKVVSGLDKETLDIISQVYASVITAGIHRAPSIKVAEAAKVIENTQRDVNIALINELAMIFNRLDIDTHEVLKAASTKWNFLLFTPGLVGGHCIGVDPYYLAHKAEQVGYTPQIIPAARRINDEMGQFIAKEIIIQLIRLGCLIQETTVTILGLSFKENVPDLRNTLVTDIINQLKQQNVTVQVHDPLVNPQNAWTEHGIVLQSEQELQKAQCIVLAVPHRTYLEKGWDWLHNLLEEKTSLVVDVKGILPREDAPPSMLVWRL